MMRFAIQVVLMADRHQKTGVESWSLGLICRFLSVIILVSCANVLRNGRYQAIASGMGSREPNSGF